MDINKIKPALDMKHDQGKPIDGVLFQDFPRALMAVASLASFGADKYERGSWLTVENGHQRYTDAIARHMLDEYVEAADEETGLGHDVAIAWNALARLELRLRGKKI